MTEQASSTSEMIIRIRATGLLLAMEYYKEWAEDEIPPDGILIMAHRYARYLVTGEVESLAASCDA